MILLSAQQRRQSVLEIGPLLPKALNISGCLSPWPTSIQSLLILRIGPLDIDFYQRLIKRSSDSLKSLRFNLNKSRAPEFEGFLSEETPVVAIVDGLFKHCLPLGSRPKLVLDDLSIQYQELHETGNMWLHVVDIAKLLTLQLSGCDRVEELLEGFQKIAQAQPLRLQRFGWASEKSQEGRMLAVQDLLRYSSGLQYLNLWFVPARPADVVFDIQCLKNHASILSDLYIGIGSHWHRPPFHVFSQDDIEWLCPNLLSLRQLALPLPSLGLSDAFAGRWAECGHTLVSQSFRTGFPS